MKSKTWLRVLIVTAGFQMFLAPVFGASDLQKSLQEYINKNFPDNRFVVTPFGADRRYSVKSTWIYLKDLQKQGNDTTRVSGWVVFSNGNAVYPENLVKVYRDPVTLSVLTQTNDKKLALAASLLGTIKELDSSAELKAALESAMEFSIEIPQAEVEYAYYGDFLLAQKMNGENLDQLASLLKARYNNEIPWVKVITTSLRVKGAKITATVKSGVDVSIMGKVKEYLTNLGFSFSSDKSVLEKLTFDDWRYLAYESITAKEGTVKVSSTGEAPPEEATLPEGMNTNAFLKFALPAAK